MKSICLFILLSCMSVNLFAQGEVKLSQFLKMIQEQNLDLKVDQAKLEAAQAKSQGLSIPPPMVSFNQMTMDSGMKANGFEVSQTIPFPTKISNDYSARKNMAKSQEEMQLGNQNEILAQAKLLYFTLWANQEKLDLLRSKKSILQEHIKLSRSTARSDSFAGIHILKAESDTDFLENEIEAKEQTLLEIQFQIAALLNKESSFKFTAIEPPLSEIPQVETPEQTHQLKALKFELESYKSKESEAKSSWFPELSLKYKEMGATDTDSRYNEIMVGISLPFVFFWGPNSESKTASAERMQAELQFEKKKRAIESEKHILSSKVENLKKQIETLKTKLIPRAEKRMKLTHNLTPRDMETIQDHRETMEAFPDLKMKALELRFEYEKSIADLEKYKATKGLSYE